MLRKAGITLSPPGCVKCIGTFTATAPASAQYRPQSGQFNGKLATRRPDATRFRTYAIVADGRCRDAPYSNIPWPEVTSANAIPSPYEIFNQKKGSPYSKKRFYELVKIYHPDRHNQSSCCGDGISELTKLERYRLVVAANSILSDPAKRAAYDAYGAGWRNSPDILNPGDKSSQNGSWAATDSGRGWTGGPNGPQSNATWEDWEKWYNNDAKQEPIYSSNGTFVMLIFVLATIGFVGQSKLADNFSKSFTHQIDTMHRDMSKELMIRRKISSMNGNKSDRVYEFLRARELQGQGYINSNGESSPKLLRPPEARGDNDGANYHRDIGHSK